MKHQKPANLDSSVIECEHAKLEQVDSREPHRFKRICPGCHTGWLHVTRLPLNPFLLLRDDRCSLCGQRVRYTDESIAGEPFAD